MVGFVKTNAQNRLRVGLAPENTSQEIDPLQVS
jgi:hypothetical protein